MTREELKSQTFIGVIEDNKDPKRLGRCKVRVLNIFDNIPVEDLPWASPWKDLNGNEFRMPEVGKVVSVIFDEGNPYKPEFIFAEHFNINLENKLKNVSEEDYLTFKSIFTDHSTQIYRSKSEGLRIDHEYSNVNLQDNGNINLNLRDNNAKLHVGSPDSAQSAVLGTSFMAWMDTFVEQLLGSNGGAYLGNLGAPVVPTPGFIDVLVEYQESRTPKFLSKHVWIVDNDEVKEQEREYINQKGDNWKSTVTENQLTTREDTPYTPEARPDTGRPEVLDQSVPNDIQSETISSEVTIKTVSVGNYDNGKIPLDKMKKNKYLSKSLSGGSSYLMAEASDAFDAMMSAYESSSFTGKQKVSFTDGYRSYEQQENMLKKYGAGRAAKPGTSNHGWGIAVDFWWGVKTSMHKNVDKRPAAYKHPVYLWFLNNGYKFGWYNPNKLRDDSKTDEWWHWEYHGKKTETKILSERYKGEFTSSDIEAIKASGGTYKA